MTSISKKIAQDRQAVIDYIENVGYAEIPAIQRKFKLSYRLVRDIVAELTADKRLIYKGGVRYESTVVKFRKDVFGAAIRADDKREAIRSYDSDGSGAANASDRSSQMDKLLWELREKRLQEIRRTLCKMLDPEVKEWLSNALVADKNLTFRQALKQAQSELSRAKKSGNTKAITTYTNVTGYLSTCDDLTFEQLKKSLTLK